MKLWTGRFIAGLVVVVIFVVDARAFGPDPSTGEPRHLSDSLFYRRNPETDEREPARFMQTGIASFIFLLDFLFVISHAGSWGLARLRRRKPEDEARSKGKSRKRRSR